MLEAGPITQERRLHDKSAGMLVFMSSKNSNQVRSKGAAGSELHLRAVFEILRDAIVFTDNDGRCADANWAATALFGLSKEELIGRDIHQLLEPEPGFTQVSPLRRGGCFQGEFQIRRPDGTALDVESFGLSDLEPGLHCSVLRNITRRKNAERTLLETETRHNVLMENAPDPILVLQDNLIAHGNSAAVQFYGAGSLERLRTLSLADLICPDEWESTRREIQEVLEGGHIPSHESRHLCLDGREIPVEINAAPMLWQHKPAAHLIVHDISERKKTERALQDSAARLLHAQQLAHLGSWDLDVTENRLTWSDEVYRIFGLKPQEFKASYEAFLDRVHPEDRAAVDAAYSESIRDGRESYKIEHRIVQASTGEVRWVHEKCENIRDSAGKICRSIGMVLDITERKQAEARQDLTADILKLLNQNSGSVPAVIGDILGRLKKWTGFDAAGLRLRQGLDYPYYYQTGFSEEFVQAELSLCERTTTGAVMLDDQGRPAWGCTCGLVLSGRIDYSLPFFTEGGSFWTNDSSALLSIPSESDSRVNPRNRCIHAGYRSIALIPIRSGQEIIGLLQLNDRRMNQLTPDYLRFLEGLGTQLGLALKRMQVQEELKLLNQSLEQQVADRTAEIQKRSEQLRVLALELTRTEQRERQRLAGVLHEGLQQVLVAAKYRLALVKDSQDISRLADEVAGLIDEAIKLSRSLTAELSPPILRQAGFLAGLEWLCRWMRDKHSLVTDLNIHETSLSLPQDLSLFLFQAVRELLFNVVKHAGVGSARIEVDQEKDHILVAVEDAGAGFDPSRQKEGRNQGFGLFSLSERINTIGGSLTIQAAPGKGTRIDLKVPIVDDTEDVLPPEARAVANVSRLEPAAERKLDSKIRVFLADDHVIVRRGLAGLIGREADMELVGEASDGKSAVERIIELKPDVVLMDISMPIMDGIEATRIIHRENPSIRVIGFSMFAAVEQATAIREAGAVTYLTKSGPAEDLLTAIRSCGSKQKCRSGEQLQ